MPEQIPSNSVGIVKPNVVHIHKELKLDCGQTLKQLTLAYETYGTLNADKTNAILVCHALSGDQHAAGYHSMEDKKPGWWDTCIGPGKPFDTNKYFVVCPNNLGGCKGSTGPNTVEPETGKLYASRFPVVTVRDWVNSQKMLQDELGIQCWAAVIGGSLGGMQAMQWAIDYPKNLLHALVIAAAPKLTAQNIAFNEVARQAIKSDPDFKDGNYYHLDPPKHGLMLARMLGHITYLSEDSMHDKFGRDLREEKFGFDYSIDFEVESYLHYQGRTFVDRFDANTYLLMTRALDYFDPAADFDHSLSKAFQGTAAKFLVVSFTTDWRFSSQRSHEIVRALTEVEIQTTYAEITAKQGHDSFLMAIPQYMDVLEAYMKNRVEPEII